MNHISKILALLLFTLAVACSGNDDTAVASSPTAHDGPLLTAACTTCHGADLGGGDTPAEGALYGPNLTPDSYTGLGGWTDDQITQAITTGVDDEGENLCSVMPRFTAFSDAQTKTIVAYLRSLTPISRSVPAGECPDDAFDASPDDTDDTADASDANIISDSSDASNCLAYASPDVPASCHACNAGEPCNPNGCFGNYYCNEIQLRCEPLPPGC